MRKYLILFLLAASPASAQIKTITGGGYQYPNGSACASCTLTLQLTVDATVSGTGQIAPKLLSYTLDASGNVPSGSTIWGNDQLQPNGTTYKASLVAVGGGQLWGPEYLSIAGASPINLAQLIPVANPAVFFSNPAVTNLNNTFTGTNTFTGANTFGKINGVCIVDGTQNATLQAAVTCAGTSGMVEAGVPSFVTPALTANVTIPAGVTFKWDCGTPLALGNFNLTIAGASLIPSGCQAFNINASGSASFTGPTPQIDVTWYGALGNGINLHQCSISSGTANLTCTDASFASPADVNKTILVIGAGASGASLVTSISSVTSSTVAVLAANAGTTLTAGKGDVYYGTDDWQAITNTSSNQTAASGWTIFFPPPRIFISKKSLAFFAGPSKGNITWTSSGQTPAKLVMTPILPLVAGQNSTFITFSSSSASVRRQIAAGAIGVGSSTITAQNASDTTDLLQGDFLFISECDGGTNGNFTSVDWVQVASVASTTITLTNPTRSFFPNLRTWAAGACTIAAGGSGLAFQRITTLIQNQVVQNLSLLVPNMGSGNTIPVVYGTQLLNVRIQHVTVDSDAVSGTGGISMQSSKDVFIDHDYINHGRGSTSEISGSVDVDIADNSFQVISSGTNAFSNPGNQALTLDFGTQWFTVHDNHFLGSSIAVLLTAVSNGTIHDNWMDFVFRSGGAGAIGFSGQGVQSVTLHDNLFSSGTTGSGSLGTQFGTTSGFVVNISSGQNIDRDNVVGVNGGWTTRSSMAPNDVACFPANSLLKCLGSLGIQAPQYNFPEGASPGAGGAGVDNCYGDSAAHALKCNYNGAANFLPMQQIISTSLTTTAATTDNVTVTGMTSTGHCYLTATNSGAAGGIASVFISAKTTNQITVTHTATSGWTFDVVCTPQ